MRKLRRTEEERDNLRRKMDESYDTTESINLVKEERIQHLSSEVYIYIINKNILVFNPKAGDNKSSREIKSEKQANK